MQPLGESPIITLTTDFGLANHYVGTMKGVLLSRCSGAQIVDVSHEIPAFSIRAGAYAIDQAARYFPVNTVHVVVVDPGVGTARRALAVEAAGQYFVAPDNGVLSLVLLRDRNSTCYEIVNRDWWLPNTSSTFHGRDVFAPVGAALASGVAQIHELGRVVDDVELLPDLEPEQMEAQCWRGVVLSIDRFGNVITNFGASAFRQIAHSQFGLSAKEGTVTEFHRTFGEAPPGVCFAYFGSSGYIELGMNQANAAEVLGVSAGSAITLRL